jgi:small subunit ribosomal protein S3
VYTAKASLILGKTGENKEQIETKLFRKLGLKTELEVREIKQPDLNAKIV